MGEFTIKDSLVSFESPAVTNVTSAKVYFNPVQEGTGDPSPENIRPITGWTEATLYKTGKNLYSSANGGQYMYLALKQGSVLTASCHLGGKITFYDKDKNAIEQYNMTSISNNRYYITITLENDCCYVRFNRQSGSQYCQLELGSEATAYEPYKGPILPSEYQEVECIQGTSNARIDTGVQGNNDNLVISGKVYLNKFSAYQGLFGNYVDEDHNVSRLILYTSANGAVIVDVNRRAGRSSAPGVGFYAGNVGEFKVSKTKLIFNGTEYSYGGVNNATANDTNILLNVANPATTTSNSELYRRWYYFRINDGDTALRNYIPCYRKSDNKPGMYDTVTNQFFASSGTEEFTAGSNVYYDTIPVSWETEAGTVYGGYVDLVKGEVIATKKIFTPTNFTGVSGATNNGYAAYIVNNGCIHNYNDVSDIFTISSAGYAAMPLYSFMGSSGINETCHFILPSTITSKAEADAWLAEHPFSYTRKLSTPITYQLTPETIKTLKGQNNFWGNTNADTEITYEVADALKMTQIRKNILMSQPHLTSASANPLTFQTDISANLKDCKIYFEPVQDLHGYDKPWPVGGGVNAIPYAVAKTETVGGLTFSTDGKGIYTVTGTPTDIGYVYFDLIEPFTIPDGAANKFHFLNNIAASQIQVAFINVESVVDTWSVNPAKRSANYSRMSNKPCTRIRIGCTNLNRTNPIDLTLKLMIVPNETVVTDYIPYENICPITGWDGVTVTRCGKNLIKPMTDTDFWGDGWINSNGSITSASTYAYTKVPLKVQAGTYTISSSNSMGWRGIYASDMSGNKLEFTQKANVPISLTVSEDALLSIYVQRTATDVQLECNSEPTAYEPYIEETSITIPFPQTIYSGYVDLVKGEVAERWVCTDMDAFKWTYVASTKRFESQYLDSASRTAGLVTVISDVYDGVENVPGGSFNTYAPDKSMCFNTVSGRPYVILKDSDYTDAESFKTSLSGHKLAYKRATPITHQLADGLTHITLGQDISPRPNGRSSTGGYANSTATGIDGCKFVYFELGWPTEAFLQYSADISRRSEFVSDSRVLINGTTTDAKLGEMVISTGSATDYDGDALVYLYVSVPSDCTDLESKRAYLAEHPIKITYPKKTPIPYTVDLTDLKPIKGTNNIWSNANNNIEVKFWKH